MIFFFIFILMLTIYEIYKIAKDDAINKKDKIRLYIIYSFFLICTVSLGMYYYLNESGKSILFYIFNFLNIQY